MIILARTGTFQIARPETVFLSFSKSCQKFEAVIGTKLVPSLEMLNTTVWELPLATVFSIAPVSCPLGQSPHTLWSITRK